ncbi:hypothetical protein DOT_2188 [Desulfosporosinus sp. OT]|nr:hypothetical protein DOT_2188 [Desulfosporosinus sp. OT]
MDDEKENENTKRVVEPDITIVCDNLNLTKRAVMVLLI